MSSLSEKAAVRTWLGNNEDVKVAIGGAPLRYGTDGGCFQPLDHWQNATMQGSHTYCGRRRYGTFSMGCHFCRLLTCELWKR